MKRPLLIACLTALTLGACRTTEANYRAAYEKAKAHRGESDGIDGTIYDAIRRETDPRPLVVGGDTIPARRLYVTPVEAPDGIGSGAYNVVVAQFKQLFNARSMRDRLRSAGYDGAMILSTPEPLYYVTACSAPDAEGAAMLYKEFVKSEPIATKAPFPWVLITR